MAKDMCAELERRERLERIGVVEPAPCTWTLKELLARMISRAQRRTPASAAFYRGLHVTITDHFGEDRPIDTITRSDVDAWAAELSASLSPSTVNHRLKELRHALRMAREEWPESGYTGNPFRGWRPLEVPGG